MSYNNFLTRDIGGVSTPEGVHTNMLCKIRKKINTFARKI